MKMTVFCILGVLMAVYVNAGTLAETFDGLQIQGAATDPSLTLLIPDNASHTISLKDAQGKKLTWFGLNFNGSGTCIVRAMGSTSKASYPAIPVASLSTFQRVVNKNAAYLNYSGCVGTTATSAGTGNSILELH